MFEINNAQLKLYAEAFEKLKANFKEVVIQKIPRSENQTADELARLVNSLSSLTIEHPIEQVSLVAHIDKTEGITLSSEWRTMLIEFLQVGVTLVDQEEACLLKKRARQFTLVEDQLYKRVFSRALLKCVGPEDAEYILKEVHQGSCGDHPGNHSMARKNIICRFGNPRLLVSDNGRQFTGQKLRELCEGYAIQQVFTSAAYSQSNGQAKVANRKILKGLRAWLNHTGGSWVDEPPSVLWALRMTPKEGTGVTPFHLVYDGEAVVPTEVGVESDRVRFYDEGNVGRRFMELDLVDETWAKAVIS
ncbi:uncharacterized protein LOC122043646 [Zingiber officinale]|uniref:uncharacterized protein LOC122043646 n=1 Tax=Zingiber officinale TaxID=94328 RepID=UPI001C4C6380|nr:uncharacterized protein LOC122043646 [Zingiber officinale]